MSLQNTLIIAGDICPVSANFQAFLDGDPREVFDSELLRTLKSSAGWVGNLETPICQELSPIIKSGPALRAPKGTGRLLKKSGMTAACLANNHILDHGSPGYYSTIQELEENNILYFGAGIYAESARRYLLIELDGICIGLYACAEHEFTIAQRQSPGANGYDPQTLLDIQELSKRADITIVLYHGMHELYRYPSPQVKSRCHAIADSGADFIFCQHSHCIGCWEKYNKTSILYGQGDFCFTSGDTNPMRSDGLLALIDLSTNDLSFIPVVNDGKKVSFPNNAQKDSILTNFEKRSAEITSDSFIDESWASFCNNNAKSYCDQIISAFVPGKVFWIIRLLRKLFPKRFALDGDTRTANLLNLFQCEAHNTLMQTYLSNQLDVHNEQ